MCLKNTANLTYLRFELSQSEDRLLLIKRDKFSDFVIRSVPGIQIRLLLPRSSIQTPVSCLFISFSIWIVVLLFLIRNSAGKRPRSHILIVIYNSAPRYFDLKEIANTSYWVLCVYPKINLFTSSPYTKIEINRDVYVPAVRLPYRWKVFLW